MYEQLLGGAELKLAYGLFHLNRMSQSLNRDLSPAYAAIEASGAIVDSGWQRSLYPHLDAFLSAVRSIPEIINCCLGVDTANREMKIWFGGLPTAEQARRQTFAAQFKPHYDSFRALPLGRARHISEHRTGVAPATVTISGLFGITYVGTATRSLPISETRQVEPEYQFLVKPRPLQPRWDDFSIDGQPLFPACQDYLNGAQALVNEARKIAAVVHGTDPLTSPPA